MVKGDDLQHVDNLSIFNYPQEIITKEKKFIENLFRSHKSKDIGSKKEKPIANNALQQFIIDGPIPHKIKKMNASTICINENVIIGLLLEKDDNLQEYEGFFRDLIYELIVNEKRCSFIEEFEIEIFLITIFIDLRRYEDENIKERLNLEYSRNFPFHKIFLFGIDEVGKSSLLRRIKTGEYSDNYFTPTKKFNIQYIQDGESGLLAFWDMPGQYSFRKKWLLGSQDSNILIYMIDVSDQIRFEESKKELDIIINHHELADVPLLIIGNKIDLINHINSNDQSESKNYLDRIKKEILNFFNFEQMQKRNWKFIFSSVKTGYNIKKIFESIKELISS